MTVEILSRIPFALLYIVGNVALGIHLFHGVWSLFQSLGYAYVGVNMRGTGCSGGSFRFFEYTQSTVGYDVVEAIAAQPWVKNNRVGMVGLSYPGITQLFVARTRPPGLAAIAVLCIALGGRYCLGKFGLH